MRVGACIAISLGAAAAGFAGGYFVAKKKLQKEADAKVDAEIQEVRKALDKVLEARSKKAKRPGEETENTDIPTPMTEEEVSNVEEARSAYDKAPGKAQEPTKPLNTYREEVDFSDPSDYEAEPFDASPYPVTIDEAMDNEDGWEVISLVYYGGNTLTDERSEELVPIEETCGHAVLDLFHADNPAHGYCRDGTLYVKAPRNRCYYEIYRDNHDYTEVNNRGKKPKA